MNYSALSKEIGVNIGTIKSWVSILEAGKIIYILEPYYENFGKRIIKSPKIYWLDTGLVCYLTGLTSSDHIRYGLTAGALFENLIVTETLKYLNNEGLFNKLYYLRTSNQQEIDLLTQSGDRLYTFEIKMTKSPKPAMIKQIESIKNIFPILNIQQSTVVCMADNGFPLNATSKAINLKEYIETLKQICV